MKEFHSYGVILFKNHKVLMVCRKDSIGFCEFVKGKYKTELELKKLFSFMTKDELMLLENCSFEQAYCVLWNTSIQSIDYNKYHIINQKHKFELWKKIWHPICVNLLSTNKYYLEAEWGFPKGKKEGRENGLQAALRELYEETR